MNKIEKNRIGCDDMQRTVTDILDWYRHEVNSQDIPSKLQALKLTFSAQEEVAVIDFIITNFDELIAGTPKRLSELIELFDNKPIYKQCTTSKKFKKKGGFRDNILVAFDYKSNRSNLLIQLASKLNIKSCPYCNMHYTLVIGIKSRQATFDFDHFFRKDIYPFLSMSFYNLIPACKVCNQRKSTKKLSIDFNPYHTSIHELFVFKVCDPIDLFLSKNIPKENIKIEVVPTNKKVSINDFNKFSKLEEHYSRHSDIAKEIYHKSKLLPYYFNPKNFSFLQNNSNNERIKLLIGTYIDPSDIEKRPLTKFIQDIWDQALTY